jgi:hypothetical protein
MTGDEIAKQIAGQRTAEKFFIKWWRKEEDWLDFDLIDIFLQNVTPDEEIGGFDLLDMEEMWQYVQRVAATRVARTNKKNEEVIEWRKKSGEELVCPFTPDTLIRIFDVESHGNFVD